MTTQPRRGVRLSLVGALVALPVIAAGADLAAAAPTPPPVGSPPVAVISLPAEVYDGIPVTLSGAGSTTPTGGISEWEWDLDNSGSYEHDSTSASWVTKSFDRGRRTVKLRVRNTAGLVATATKTFTVIRPPLASTEPGAPTAVGATVEGTSIDVTWEEPADAATAVPVAYRVSNSGDALYVPADAPLEATFDDLVPGQYTIRVAAINRLGTGPSTGTEVEIVAKGATPTSSATASATPTASGSDRATGGATPAPGPSVSAAASSSGDDRDLIGYGLIAAGAVVLVGAAVTGGVAAWRRRRSPA